MVFFNRKYNNEDEFEDKEKSSNEDDIYREIFNEIEEDEEDDDDYEDDEEDDEEIDNEEEDNDTDNEEDKLNAAYEKAANSGSFPNPEEFGFNETQNNDQYSNEIGSDYDRIGKEIDGNNSEEYLNEDEYENNVEEESDDNNDDEEDDEEENLTFWQLINSKNPSANKLASKILTPLLFVMLLGLFMITYKNNSEARINENIKLQRQVRELRAQSITIAAQLMKASKESSVSMRIENLALGIHEITEPPMYFNVAKYERTDSLINEAEIFKQKRKEIIQKEKNSIFKQESTEKPNSKQNKK
ncbi:MAG: hypothetical protein MJ211_06765 [Bacteroidales bacterium]|nr:hypothetical protein [Bacteroidales bacterium]